MSFNTDCLLGLNQEDFDRYVKGTYVKIRLPEQKEYVYGQMMEFTHDAVGDSVYLVGLDKNSVVVKPNKLDANFVFPKFGLYNHKKHAVLYTQTNYRQYLRGLNAHSHIIQPLLWEIPYVHNLSRKVMDLEKLSYWSSKDLTTIFLSTDQRTIKEKLAQVRNTDLWSVAISTDFAFSVGIYDGLPSIWFRSHIVGSVQEDNSVKITNEVFKQEVVDFFEKEGFQINV